MTLYYNTVRLQIDALEEVVNAVGDKMEVFADGGIRRGTDVFKALARGARAVFIGRLPLWGLTYKVDSYFRMHDQSKSWTRIV